jgi:hypothetical protein
MFFDAPPGCLSASFSLANNYNFFCDTCDAVNYVRLTPTDPYCLNMVCAGSPYMSINKQCISSDLNCDSRLCIWNTPEFLVAGKYSFFELTFSGTQIAIQVKKDWRYFFMFEVKQFAVFNEVSATEKQIFCRLISENLNDDQSICTWINDEKDNPKIILDVSPAMYRKLIASTSTPFLYLKKSALVLKRKLITDTPVQNKNLLDSNVFNPPLDIELGLTFNTKGFKDSNWLPVSST